MCDSVSGVTMLEGVLVLGGLAWCAMWLERERRWRREEAGIAWFRFKVMLMVLSGDHSELWTVEERDRFAAWLGTPGAMAALLRAGVADALVPGGLLLVDLVDEGIDPETRMTRLESWTRQYGVDLARLRHAAGLRGSGWMTGRMP